MGFTEVFDYIILVLGVAIIIYGLVVLIKQKPSLTLDYNWEKVKDEDIKKFTAAYGISYSIMGLFMTLLAISRIFIEGKYRGFIFILYFIAYFIFMFILREFA